MRALIIIPAILLCLSCKQDVEVDSAPEEEVIAEVGDRKLYTSKFKDLYDSDIDSLERSMMIKGLISNWLKDQLLVIEAEKNLPPDVEIDALVEDYRASLMVNYYINQLVEKFLDTVVTQEQKQSFYDKNRSEFILSESVFKGVVLKIPVKRSNREIRQLFKEEDYAALEKATQGFAVFPMIRENEWFSTSEVLAFLPSTLYSENTLRSKGNHTKKDRDFEYFVKTIDFAAKNEIAPLEFIDSKITQVILNNRKKSLISRKKQQLYDENYSNNKIKIHI